MVGGQSVAAAQFIARLNEAARTLAGSRDEADAKPCVAARPSALGKRQSVLSGPHPPVERGSQSLGHRLDFARLYLPPPSVSL